MLFKGPLAYFRDRKIVVCEGHGSRYPRSLGLRLA
jgi:hypothetical protein